MLAEKEITAPNWEQAGLCPSCNHPKGEKPPKGVRCWYRGDHVCGARHGGGFARCGLRHRDCKQLYAADRAARLGVLPDKVDLSAIDIVKALHKRHATPLTRMQEWLVMDEFQIGNRRADVVALRLWNSSGYRIVIYEVKVDPRDLALELRDPSKRRPAIDASTEFCFATPRGFMDPSQVPAGCGLVEVGLGPKGAYQSAVVVQPDKRRLECVSPQFLWGISYRLTEMQRKVRSRGIVL